MNQNIWGSHLWFSLHTITLNYPLKPTNDDKENYKSFFISLKNVIPCSVCKKNYKRHLNEHPIDNHLNSRKELVYWLIDIHNMVNGEIGKKILSYDTVLKKYENVYHKKNILNISDEEMNDTYNKDNNIYFNIINIFFIIFLLLLVINFVFLIIKKKIKN
jgi:hypothetical protein